MIVTNCEILRAIKFVMKVFITTRNEEIFRITETIDLKRRMNRRWTMVHHVYKGKVMLWFWKTYPRGRTYVTRGLVISFVFV